MKSLPIRVLARPSEPAHSLALRLATRHGAKQLLPFLRSIDLSLPKILAGEQVAHLAEKAGVDAAQLISSSVVVQARNRCVNIGSEKIKLGNWSLKVRRICPACIEQDIDIARRHNALSEHFVFHRLTWDVQTIRNCPVHRTQLTSRCPRCKVELKWLSGTIDRCSNGCSLAHTGDRQLFSSDYDNYFADRLGMGGGSRQQLLDRLSFEGANEVCRKLGQIQVIGWARKRSRDTDRDHLYRRAGWSALSYWPDSLWQALDQVVAQSPRSNDGSGIILRYGWIYQGWLASERTEVTALFAPIVRAHAVARGIIDAHDQILSTHSRAGVSLTGLVRATGIGFERCRRTLREKGLIPVAARPGVSMQIEYAKASEALKITPPGCIGAREVARTIGCGRGRLAEFEREGVLTIGVEGCARTAVETVLLKLRNSLEQDEPPPASRPLKYVCRSSGLSIVRVYKALIEGRIKAWPTGDPIHFGNVSLLTQDVRALKCDDRGTTLVKASKQLTIHPECVRQLVRHGHIKRLHGRAIDQMSVDDFGSKYQSLSEIARSMGLKNRVALTNIVDRGATVVFSPPLFRQIILHRLH